LILICRKYLKMVEKNVRAFFRFFRWLTVTFGLYAIWLVGGFFVADESRWRQKIFSRWARTTAKTARMKIEVRGKLPRPPFFLVSNHLSYMDIAAFASAVECFFVAKSEVADWFLLGKIARRMGTVFVKRQSRRDISRATNEIVGKIRGGENLMLFPEGTSSDGAGVLPFKSSFLEIAARHDFPVSFASINYQTTDKSVKPSESICWWGDADFLPHLWRLFQIETFTATITFGDEAIRNPSRKELTRQLHSKVRENFVPVL